MRSLRLALLCAVAALAVPHAARAIPVTIDYAIVGGANNGTLLGGANPTGGSARVTWQLSSLNGFFSIGAAASFNFLKITNASGTITLLPTGRTFIQKNAPSFAIGTIATGWTSPVGVTKVKFAGLAPGFTPGYYRFTAHFNPPYATFAPCRCTLNVAGPEIRRAVTPEPTPGALFALGLFGLAAGRTFLRRRDRRSA